MAKRGPVARPGRRRTKARNDAVAEKVEDYRHGEKRTNNPPAGLATYDKTAPSRKPYSYDPHLDPQLVWAGKAERLSFDVENVALHIHERISTAAIIRAVQRDVSWVPQAPLSRRSAALPVNRLRAQLSETPRSALELVGAALVRPLVGRARLPQD